MGNSASRLSSDDHRRGRKRENDLSDDDTFRLIMGFTFAVFLPFALYYRLRSKTDEYRDYMAKTGRFLPKIM